jgi:kynurenine formamidase
MCVAFCILVSGCSSENAPPQPEGLQFPDGRLIDLTHPFSSETIYWPTAKPFTFEKVSDGVTPGGYYYAANNFSAAEHGGTHLDAPIHFAAGKNTADQIPLEQLTGPAVVIDVTASATANADYQIQISDIEAWETKNGRIPDSSIILLRTGWDSRWPDPKTYLGTSKVGPDAVAELHFPGLDPKTAQWIVANRRVDSIGIDTPSIDYGQSTMFETHQTLFKANIPAFENVANLGQLPVTGSIVIALPMKIKGGSGGPLRIVAVAP